MRIWRGGCNLGGAALAVAAMFLPIGRRAGLAALGWMLVCVLMAVDGLRQLLPALWTDADRGVRAILGIAKIDLAVGGAWLVASRLGIRPMGIQEPIGLLTAVHFHYAGFATALIAAAMLRLASERGVERLLRWLVLMVATLPFVVAAGFVVSPALKMAAAVMFSASVAVLAVFLRSYAKQMRNATARVLLHVAVGAVFVGMVFSGIYAVADFVGRDVLIIPQMARTHGILNAVGFCLPALLGWLVESQPQR